MAEKTLEWYQKELRDRFQHFFMFLDGSYNFPNSLEGDLLKMTHNMLRLMEKENSNPPFVVGEYYADEYGVYKILENGECMSYSLVSGEFNKCLQWYTLNGTIPATNEQVKMFKVAKAIENSGLTPEQHKQMILDGKINLGVWSALQTKVEKLEEGKNQSE
ncbi:hypothetical protein [Enterococcus termitis]|uniref:Uncharacterized protein n=1 Tax=Enterococcus termitis TaxID=332950 RepID=A0A1E5GVY6_9ENTE|nr:hypothetical protein [Enterococcus termitis]OEG16797.1 hypothetical protein BCR25_04160 [Enterococcus termitis]